MSKPRARASMASSVDLPTPEPAKMPMRCPAQSGVKMSMTRTPVRIAFVTRARRIGVGGSPSTGTPDRRRQSGPPPSSGCAERIQDAALPACMRIEEEGA